ncbi:prefoldin subunit alpha [Methanobacterium aggregans]|uniref:prefoldin subunit alpha n=1 Tax=Methanobacterium aggregans TaxID=1615586 RepID=UPI001AE7A287|nr:prefoldin subunit alpha [Methanobacterium aggregans]MBP2046504.1 prefoldin alpha subunit [Methanobacterium aggregans]
MEDKQRLQALVDELNMYQSQAELLQQQIEGLKATITDITIAKDTLKAINGKDDTETMVPIGAGSFVMTELKNTDEVVVSLGAGVAVKKKIADAEETLEDQKKELEGVMQKMNSDLQKITEYIMKKSPEAEALLQKVEGQVGV